jgi:hypothetical protein
VTSSAYTVANRFLVSQEGPESDPAVETVMAGIALLIAQSVIVKSAFFDEQEIRKFLLLRRGFHGQFTQACEKLADDLEAGIHGPAAASAAPGLRKIAQLPLTQDRQALVQTVRLMRQFKHIQWSEASPVVRRLLREIVYIQAEGDPDRTYGEDYQEFFKTITRLWMIPTPIKTFLRKIIQIGKGHSDRVVITPHEDENPGAWFDMPPDQQEQVRKAVQDAENLFSQPMPDKTPEEKQAVWQGAREQLTKIQRDVGVNLDLVKRQDTPKEDLALVLKREQKQEMDGGSLFILQSVIQQFEGSAKYQVYQKKPLGDQRFDETKIPLPREAGKVVTLLRKAKTIATAKRIITEAAVRGLVSRSFPQDMEKTFEQLKENKAIHDGVPLVALHFEPTTVEQFQQDHDTGAVEMPPDMPKDQQEDLLGKVSRAITDLEGVFGQGFCGKHKKKLAFSFKGSHSFMAKAHYFAWDNRNEWQPRVTFSEDYEGVLAHELSHYFEDLIAYRLDEKMNAAEGKQTSYGYSGGPGDIFGRSSAEYFTQSYVEGTHAKRKDALHEMLPEAFELMAAVVNTPDYARWEDKLGSSYETAIPMAVQQLTGESMYLLPKDHPYANAYQAEYKSQLPPELVKEAEKQFSKLMDGDTRKLGYYQSAAEVWARMCEQYVYTKLSRAGIVNPWLTWLTYNQDVYVEQARFEKEIEPIFNRLFAKLGTKNILARIVGRFRTAR